MTSSVKTVHDHATISGRFGPWTLSKSLVLNVRPSVLVCDVEQTAFHCGLCGRKFVLLLFGQFPRLGNICHSWQHIGVVWGLHQSLHGDGNAAFEETSVFVVCRPTCYDS